MPNKVDMGSFNELLALADQAIAYYREQAASEHKRNCVSLSRFYNNKMLEYLTAKNIIEQFGRIIAEKLESQEEVI